MRECTVLRVFTDGDEGGNPLGVVTDLTGLDGDAMQAIATGLGFSETVFIDPDHRVRIFTPAAELPFAGHPLVGAAWALGRAGPTSGRMVCGIGEIPFIVDGDRSRVEAPMTGDVAVAPDGPAIAATAGFPEPVRAWWARMPVPYLVLEVDGADAVRSAAPDIAALAAGPAGEAAYLISRDGDVVTARFFAPLLGVDEDPATGSAAAALAAILVFEGEASGALTVLQGAEVGYPSRIGLEWEGSVVRLGGTVRHDGIRRLAT